MILNTKHFGEIELKEEGILLFEEGLPGFDQIKKFIIIDSMEEDSPFKWLQSIDEPQLAFAVVNPFIFKEDYDFILSDDTVDKLGILQESDVAVYSIIVVPKDLEKISMNLKAPIVVNTENRKAAQIILDTDKYTVRHYILDELHKREVSVNAGTNEEKGSDNYYK